MAAPWNEDTDNVVASAYGVDMTMVGWEASLLEKVEQTFQETGNPLLPWHALRWAVDKGIAVPSWVLIYFHDRAEVLNGIVCDGGDAEAEKVGRALGFGGSGKGKTAAARTIKLQQRDFGIAVHVHCEIARNVEEVGTESVDSAFLTVARRFGVSRTTAADAYSKNKKAAKAFCDNFVANHNRGSRG